ncbi:MAG: leucyl aminopeptidase [Pseudomonadota bacterium]
MDILFTSQPASHTNALVVGVFSNNTLTKVAKDVDMQIHGRLQQALDASRFKGNVQDILVLNAPHGLNLDRIIAVGLGEKDEIDECQLTDLGGRIYASIAQTPDRVAEVRLGDLDLPVFSSEKISTLVGLGACLRSWSFDKYHTQKKEDEKPKLQQITFITPNPKAARRAFEYEKHVLSGIYLTRELVSEPPNVLHPDSFAERIKSLKSSGLKIDTLNEKKMKSLGMGALLGVGQGSTQPSYLAVIQWNGTDKSTPPLAFVGKGVTFDTGGISIKPSAGMEEMKYDMGGAGVVVGLMQALASRKAKVNAVGVVGLVENMPGGGAQRPGDIVTSMSGQTIEVINTDAEGRLVLADALYYAQKEFKPQFIVDLATLTGAIVVSLGDEYAGLFSNDDQLSTRLEQAGAKVGEKLWRFPLHKNYDRLLDSPSADVQNITSKRGAGSITAAQFLQRFVEDDTPWAHLDIAGVAWADKDLPIVKKGATAFGVRLLDRMIKDNYES